MTALKVIPWGDVIEATPGIVKSARKIFTRSQQAEETATAPAAHTGEPSARIAQLEASLAEIAEQQKASAQLIETLAEQNARIVEAIETLRVRTRLLIVACAVLAAACVALAVWGLR
ncbi:MAG TPA: hypothetical protein VGD46_12870 [Rhizobacter sp.]